MTPNIPRDPAAKGAIPDTHLPPREEVRRQENLRAPVRDFPPSANSRSAKTSLRPAPRSARGFGRGSSGGAPTVGPPRRPTPLRDVPSEMPGRTRALLRDHSHERQKLYDTLDRS